jgi:ribosomal protein S18 acetylase RimI-like enzyme
VNGVTTRTLRVQEVAAAIDLVLNSFPKSLWPYMTYAQHGMQRHMSIPLQHPGSMPHRHLMALTSPGENVKSLEGFADFRVVDEGAAFLSYIAIRPESRGRGYATDLLKAFLSAHPDIDTLSLDVFRDNKAAQSLYEKLGFIRVSSSAWVTRHIPATGRPIAIRSLANSLAVHDAYGFCELELESDSGIVQVGLLGQTVLRCTSIDIFENDELLARVKRMFPNLTTVLGAIPEDSVSRIDAEFQVASRSDRLVLSPLA